MNRDITLQSPLGEDLLLQAATITEQLGQPFSMELRLLSAKENLAFDDLLGQEITVSVVAHEGDRHFHGHVVRFAQVGRHGSYATYHARVVPWLWFLTRTTDCRIFQAKTAPELIKEVLRDHGFTNLKDTLTKSYRKRDYCVQYRETDFNFIQRLMEEEGIYYYFTHADDSHTLVLADSYSGHETFPGYATIAYFPLTENEVREEDHIHDWRWERNVQPGKYVVKDYDFVKPRAELKTQYVQKRNFPKSDYEMFDYPGNFTVAADGDHYARTRLEALQAQHERVQGLGNARGIAAGSLFTLDGYLRDDQNKEYLVVSVTHQLRVGQYQSGGDAASPDQYECSFEAVDAKEPFRIPITTHKPTVGGPQTATVTGAGGDEICTDEYGRVKVQFHWDRVGQRDEKSSCWVRVAQIWAGKGWGWMSIPRVGQEVVVDFLEGDPDQPIITGRVYNADNMPPFPLPDNKTQSGIRTRSSPDGSADNCNEIRFEDKQGSEQLFIHAEKNQDIEVENDETHWVGHDRQHKVDNDENSTIGRDRSETVQRHKVIQVMGNHTENINGAATVVVGKTRAETVMINQATTVGGAMELTVGGALAITVGGVMNEAVGGNKGEAIGGSKSESTGGDKSLQVGKNLSEVIKADRTVNVGKDLKEDVEGQQQTTVKKEARWSAKKIEITAEDEINLKTGDASIIMKKNGDITIKGGKITVKGSGDVVVKGSKIAEN